MTWYFLLPKVDVDLSNPEEAVVVIPKKNFYLQ